MNAIKSIRVRLGVTQTEFGKGMGCTQGNVVHYEQGQTVPPDSAKRLIGYAKTLGHAITFNDIYMPELDQAVTAESVEGRVAKDQVKDHAAPVTAGLVNCQTAVQGA